jgi:glucose-6-phosphate dehydrogenase assembly protein OpcA
MTAEAQSTEHVADWQARGISVSSIERELSMLWRAVPGSTAEDRPMAMRTSVLNLVVYTEGDSEGDPEGAPASGVAEIIAQLAGSHPSRSIIVEAEPDHDTPSLDAALSAHCHVASAGQGKFCCEQVTITVKGEAARHVAGVVIPLLLPDLPTVVWWQGLPPLHARAFQRMVETADRLLVDSAQFGHGPAALRHAQQVRAALGKGCALADLAWTRLRLWREVVAALFDDAQRRPYARGIRSLDVTVGAPDSGEGDATAGSDLRGAPTLVPLLAGWIEAVTAVAPALTARRAAGGGVLAGDLAGLTLVAEHDGHLLEATLRRDAADPSHVVERVAIDGAPGAEARHGFATDTPSALLARELEHDGQDPIYETALACAVARFAAPGDLPPDEAPLGGLA